MLLPAPAQDVDGGTAAVDTGSTGSSEMLTSHASSLTRTGQLAEGNDNFGTPTAWAEMGQIAVLLVVPPSAASNAVKTGGDATARRTRRTTTERRMNRLVCEDV